MKNRYVKVLYKIIDKICNGYDQNENCFLSVADVTYDFHLIQGEDYDGFSS